MVEERSTSKNSYRIRLAILFLLLLLTASCVSVDCSYDTRLRPEPISIYAEEGALWGQNYKACFIMDGVIFKEYIPECAYKYYYDRQGRTAAGVRLP